MDREVLVARLQDFFRRQPAGLVAVYLFGSWSRSTAVEASDVDLGVLFDEAPPARLGGAQDRLASALEAELRLPLDLVELWSAPADLVHRVLRDGILVHEGNRSARIRFEVARRREYLDLLPILEEYRRARAAAPAATP